MPKIDDVEYFVGDELDPLTVWWYSSGTLVDFSVAHTYAAKLYLTSDATKTNVFSATKTTGFTGAAGSGTPNDGTPNLTVDWSTLGELNTVTAAGRYVLQIVATRTSDARERTGTVNLVLKERA